MTSFGATAPLHTQTLSVDLKEPFQRQNFLAFFPHPLGKALPVDNAVHNSVTPEELDTTHSEITGGEMSLPERPGHFHKVTLVCKFYQLKTPFDLMRGKK